MRSCVSSPFLQAEYHIFGFETRPSGAVLTDSAKWAYYAAGNLGVTPVLGRLRDCLASAGAGRLLRDTSYP